MIRYTLHPVLLLIPLGLSGLPEDGFRKLPRGFFLILFPLFLLLFHEEVRNIGDALRLKKTSPLPWLSEQLREKLAGLSPLPSVWVLDEYDGFYLSNLVKPHVFWMREEMFHEKPRPHHYARRYYQSNILVDEKDLRFRSSHRLPPLQPGDLVAVGVNQVWGQERKLYLLRFVHVPSQKSTQFTIAGDLPEELKLTLRNRFVGMGLRGKFLGDRRPRDRSAYWFEFWK